MHLLNHFYAIQKMYIEYWMSFVQIENFFVLGIITRPNTTHNTWICIEMLMLWCVFGFRILKWSVTVATQCFSLFMSVVYHSVIHKMGKKSFFGRGGLRTEKRTVFHDDDESCDYVKRIFFIKILNWKDVFFVSIQNNKNEIGICLHGKSHAINKMSIASVLVILRINLFILNRTFFFSEMCL